MNTLIKHPILSNFIICLLLFLTAGICFNGLYLNDKEASFIIITTILSLIHRKPLDRIVSIIFSLLILLIYLAFIRTNFFLFIGEIFATAFLFYKNRNNKYNATIFILISSFLLHLFYIQQTDINIRQHDLNGIILYINLISKSIKEFNPWYMYYLFHQPLHFIISGLVLRFETFLSTPDHIALDGLQFVSLFYVSSSIIYFSYILRELKIKGLTFYALLLLFAYNPTLTLFSGYISDDTPVFFWSTFVIYYVIRWYKTNKLKYLSYTALGFGLGTLTKISILMIVPAISFLFLCKLLSSANKKQCLFQLSVFIIIVVPLSLLWIIRNHIMFDMQFFNVPDTSPAGQSFRDFSLSERLFNFSNLFSVFISAPTVVDHNIFLSLIKTELFGEWDLSLTTSIIHTPAMLLYVLNISLKLLVLISCACILYSNVIRSKFDVFYLFFALFYLTIFIYSIKYSIDFPYVCSSDFRLFAQINVAELLLLGYLCKHFKTNKPLFLGAICYALSSFFIYTAISL